MSRYTELTARAETHLKTAEAGADDPRVAALCALATAVLAGRPTIRVELDLDDTDTSPAGIAARAVASAFEAAAEPVDDLEVDDCGFPSHASALS
ncbi:hypothetical protein [Glycomyces tenuis]|uniref:hypothetical protein n=1 Tax=Glycomyces tenuis TaxID=58116 RepID=UPI0003FF1A01|nr:hypothetical protein [Glycomyces tenuis]